MRIPLHQVDAFTETLFGGNPAAVCPLDDPIPEDLQQRIAFENQLSETAFLLPRGDGFDLRWFTPRAEVDLCGHATLAAGHVVFTILQPDRETPVRFETASGPLVVERTDEGYLLDLPSCPGVEREVTEALTDALGVRPRGVRATPRDLYALLADEAEVRSLTPDFRALAALPLDGVGVGAPGETADVVSRFFAPALGIDEDPVTGSAHATWVPWIAELTGRSRLSCRQLSERGGTLGAELVDGRVQLTGQCVHYLSGTIEV